MATRDTKSTRRWLVIKNLLYSILGYSIVMVILFLLDKDITKLDQLTTMIFSLVSVLGIGNWFSTPGDDHK